MQAECHQAWVASGEYEKACGLDRAHPKCACEAHSLRSQGGDGVTDSEVLARIFTDPASYSQSESAIAARTTTNVYGLGLSTIRQGASDQEITDTINTLLNSGAETQSLVGAAVFETSAIRAFSDPDRWFGVYATDDGTKEHHADVLGTCAAASQSQLRKLQKIRRSSLRKLLEASLIKESDIAGLIAALRTRGI